MGSKLSPEDLKLYNYIDEILFFKWDPIGVSDDLLARTEYRMYLPGTFSMVKQSKSAAEIASYLSFKQFDRIGWDWFLTRSSI